MTRRTASALALLLVVAVAAIAWITLDVTRDDPDFETSTARGDMCVPFNGRDWTYGEVILDNKGSTPITMVDVEPIDVTKLAITDAKVVTPREDRKGVGNWEGWPPSAEFWRQPVDFHGAVIPVGQYRSLMLRVDAEGPGAGFRRILLEYERERRTYRAATNRSLSILDDCGSDWTPVASAIDE